MWAQLTEELLAFQSVRRSVRALDVRLAPTSGAAKAWAVGCLWVHRSASREPLWEQKSAQKLALESVPR